MPNINLLGQNDQQKQQFTIKPSFGSALASLCAIALLAFVGFYGVISVQESRLVKQAEAEATAIEALRQTMMDSPQIREILVRQGQIKNFDKVMGGYSYWSKLLPELARNTLKTGSYTTISASTDNELRMSLLVSDFAEFDKFMQIFDKAPYNKNLYNVRVVSATQFQSDQQKGVKIEVELSINPDLIKPAQEVKS